MSSKTKKQQAQTSRNTATLSKASNLDLHKSLNSLTTAGVAIQGTLSKISEELITKHAELQAVDDAILLKKTEMENLHGVDQVLLTIDEANAQYRNLRDTQEREQEELRNVYEYEAEQKEKTQARKREEEEYKLQQTRKLEADTWAEKIRLRANEERDRHEKFEKDHAERESVLHSKEAAYNDAIAKISTFDVELKKESDKIVAIISNTLKKDFAHETAMTAVKHEAELSKIRFDNQRLVETANNMEKQVLELQSQLKSAHEAQTQLAKDAVSAAATQKNIADMQSLVTNIGGNGTRPRS
jgi:chromosome segregation ATPase